MVERFVYTELVKGSNPLLFKKLKMPTINQLVNKSRIKKKRSQRVPALQQCPQKKGVCVRILTRTPKKPNSALRKLYQ